MIRRFLDVGGSTSGVACLFGTATGVGGDASSYHETTVLQGAAGAVVTIQLQTYINNNSGGHLYYNGSEVFINDVETITLDGSGNGSFTFSLVGNAGNTGTTVLGKYTITGVSIGYIGSPSSHQISKAF